MRITDKDRELAAELIELLEVRGDATTVNLLAVILAAHRTGSAAERGRCGAAPPTSGWDAPSPCELMVGHAGWHRAGPVDWGARSPCSAESYILAGFGSLTCERPVGHPGPHMEREDGHVWAEDARKP